jgi:hypothetical protein
MGNYVIGPDQPLNQRFPTPIASCRLHASRNKNFDHVAIPMNHAQPEVTPEVGKSGCFRVTMFRGVGVDKLHAEFASDPGDYGRGEYWAMACKMEINPRLQILWEPCRF